MGHLSGFSLCRRPAGERCSLFVHRQQPISRRYLFVVRDDQRSCDCGDREGLRSQFQRHNLRSVDNLRHRQSFGGLLVWRLSLPFVSLYEILKGRSSRRRSADPSVLRMRKTQRNIGAACYGLGEFRSPFYHRVARRLTCV